MQNKVQDRYKSILEKLDYKNLSIFQERYFVNVENLINS